MPTSVIRDQIDSFAPPPPAPVAMVSCHYCRRRVPETDSRLSPNGRERYCNSCWSHNFFTCPECGRDYMMYDRQCVDGRYICRNCRTDSECWDCRPMDVSIATYVKTGSKRKYGVEVETSSCPEYRTMKGSNVFGAKYDCSVSGMEFISPILYGDEGLDEIDKFFDFADEHSFDADDDCGLHIHLDMRDENTVQLRHVAYAYAKSYAAWRCLVSEWRANDCNYCHAPHYSASDIKACRRIKPFMRDGDRYNYVNFTAYDKHGTFEVRLADGTVDRVAVKNWILAHIRFIDGVKDKTYAQIDEMFSGNAREQFMVLCGIWNRAGGDALGDYYTRRFREHGESCRDEDDDNW